MLRPDMVEERPISVNPQRGRAIGLAVLLGWLAAGCGTFSQYPMGMEQTTLAPLRTGQDPQYRKTFGKRTNGNARVLFAMEMGRTAQLKGDYETSRRAFDAAIAATQAQDDQAAISASGAAAQGGAVLVNDKVIPYRAPSHERILVHHFQALNYLATNDLAGAGVEIRRANREQEDARKRREAEIEKAKSKTENVSPDEERDPHLLPVYAGLDQMAGAVKYSFQNAATFYLSAVVWEMMGEANDAYIDSKKALEIYPENPYLQRDVLRLGRRLGMREDVADFERRFPQAAKADGNGGTNLARLVVLYEEGLAPKKSEMSVAYPLPSSDSVGVVALPVYAEAPPPPMPLVVKAGRRNLGRTAPICDVSALAARGLGEQMPGILTRQVARAVAKGVAAKAAKDQGGGWGELAVTLYNVLSEQADLRSWLTLPAHIHVANGWVDPGTSCVTLADPSGAAVWSGEVTLKPGRTTLLYVTRIDLAVYSHVIMQP